MSEQAIQDFVRFWSVFQPEGYPYVHPADRDALELHLASDAEPAETDFDYAQRPGFKFRCLPEPVVGDLRNAKVVICLLNPGFGFSDLRDHSDENVRQAISANLQQKFSRQQFPFHHLNPSLMATGGFQWWWKKFKPVFEKLKEQWDLDATDAIKSCSSQVACVELVAYHSSSFKGVSALIDALESTARMRDLVRSLAEDGSKFLIIPRSVKDWNVSGGENVLKYHPNDARHASLKEPAARIARALQVN